MMEPEDKRHYLIDLDLQHATGARILGLKEKRSEKKLEK